MVRGLAQMLHMSQAATSGLHREDPFECDRCCRALLAATMSCDLARDEKDQPCQRQVPCTRAAALRQSILHPHATHHLPANSSFSRRNSHFVACQNNAAYASSKKFASLTHEMRGRGAGTTHSSRTNTRQCFPFEVSSKLQMRHTTPHGAP